MLIDYHVHTDYTIDAHMTVQQVCKRAVELGFSEICFTNHQQWSYVVAKNKDFYLTDNEWEEHIKEIEKARKDFPELKIKLGVELDYFPEYDHEIREFTKKYPFDYIIGSVHRLNGVYFEDLEMDNAAVGRLYYETLLQTIEARYIDCVGHFDIPNRFISTPYPENKDMIMKCIKAMKDNDIGFELNAMGWHYANKMCYPAPEILKELYKAGIRKVTIGSDSHDIDLFGFKIKEGTELLKKIGFKQICTFDKRKPIYHKI